MRTRVVLTYDVDGAEYASLCGAATGNNLSLPAFVKMVLSERLRLDRPKRFDGEGGGLNRTRYEANVLDEEPTGKE